MSRPRERLTAILLLGALAMLGCSTGEDLGEASDAAARVEPVAGQDVSRVTLTRRAVAALGIRTQPAQAGPGTGAAATGVLTVPYSAVLYDTTGDTSVYRLTGNRSYLRTPVTLDHVAGDVAYVSQGIDAGTTVVTVGVPELLGAEEGVGGE